MAKNSFRSRAARDGTDFIEARYPVLIAAFIAAAMTMSSVHEALAVELTRDGRAMLPIVISESAPAEVKMSAAELSELLNKISGAEFQIETGNCWGPCGLGYYLASRVM
jgi:hypothetical protein